MNNEQAAYDSWKQTDKEGEKAMQELDQYDRDVDIEANFISISLKTCGSCLERNIHMSDVMESLLDFEKLSTQDNHTLSAALYQVYLKNPSLLPIFEKHIEKIAEDGAIEFLKTE